MSRLGAVHDDGDIVPAAHVSAYRIHPAAGIALGIEAEMVLAVEMTASRSHRGIAD